MTEKPTLMPLARRVMPSLIVNDIKGVSPITAPVMETARMITERQGEGLIDIEAPDNLENTNNQLNG